MIWRTVGTLIGLALVIVSFPLTLSPLPVGLILMFIGIVILVASNPLAASALKWARKRWPWLNRFFRRAEKVLPGEIAEPLRETDNGEGDEEEEPRRATDDGVRPVASNTMRRVNIPRRLR